MGNSSFPERNTIELSEVMVHNVKEATRTQSDSRLWYRYRVGTITASKMKQICRTSLAMPSQRLIKKICYPEWTAHERYAELMAERHDQFWVANSGLVLSPEWPHLGVSPIGTCIVCSTCCGRGTSEIKCPYCHRHNSAEDIGRDSHSCLKTSDSDNSLHLPLSSADSDFQVEYSNFCVHFPTRIISQNSHWTDLSRYSIVNSRGPSVISSSQVASGSSQASSSGVCL